MSDTELKNPIPFQINKWSLGVRLQGTGEAGWRIGPLNGPVLQAGPELHLDFCKPRNAADTGAFVGHCWSVGGGSLFDLDKNRTDRLTGNLHLFFDDARFAVPLGLRLLRRDLQSGAAHWGGGIEGGFIHRLAPPYRTDDAGGKHRFIPYWGAKLFGDAFGGNGEWGIDGGAQLIVGGEFGFFQF